MRRAMFLAFVSLACLGASQGQDNGVVLTAKRALLLGEPLLVVGQNVGSVEASPDGRYLVVYREVPNPAPVEIGGRRPEPLRKDLVVWDSATRTLKEVPVGKDVRVTREAQWLPGTDRKLVAMGSVSIPVQPQLSGPPTVLNEVFILDCSDAKMTRVESMDMDKGRFVFVVSPVAPIAVELCQIPQTLNTRETIVLQTLRADGTFDKRVTLPEKYVYFGRTEWSPDARELLIEVERVPEGRGGALYKVVVHYDPSSGEFYETTGPTHSYQKQEPETDVRLDPKPSSVTEGGATAKTVSWWLRSTTETERPVALVSEHAAYALLPTGEKYVAFVANGALFVRWTVQLDVQQYLDMLEAAKRAVLVSNAKQIALAAAMYSADYDDVLPPNLSKDDLMPYLRNEDVFKNGWVYSFAGGDLKNVKDPANTVLGYIEGPGGRAVAYVDGHVKWVPN